jgi:pyrrolysine biosynthesis protein PylD
MTRLTTDDIASIADKLQAYDEELIAKTGCTLAEIACQATGIAESEMKEIAADIRVGVVPITFGQGIIAGFGDIVAAIVSHVGCKAFVTQQADVAGWAESLDEKADILMFADDDRFIAVDVASRQVADNAVATAKGFVAGLGLMTGGLKQKNVLVIGCGPVGCAATEALIIADSIVSIYDINSSRSDALALRIKPISNTDIDIVKDIEQALTEHQFIVDATPTADIIRAHHISAQTYVSAPGVPVGLDKDAQVKISNRLLHDPLQIGVATMIACALKSQIE